MRLLLATLLGLSLLPAAALAADQADVRAAIIREVQERLGGHADVRIASIDLAVAGEDVPGRLKVTPEPAARIGRPSVFSVTVLAAAGPRRIGSAVVTLTAAADRVWLVRDVERGETLTGADIGSGRGAIDGAPLTTLPAPPEVEGARVLRDLPRGTVVTTRVVAPVPMVRSGQQVVLRVRIGRAEVTGMGVATENGRRGEVIRVVNPDSRRTIVGRVVAPGEVEVMHVS